MHISDFLRFIFPELWVF